MKLSPAKKKFVELATEMFGEKAVLNRSEINEVMSKHDLGYPSWFMRPTFKSSPTSRGEFRLPSLNEENVVMPSYTVAAPAVSEKVITLPTSKKVEVEETVDNYVPNRDGNYVKFGETIYGNNRFSFETTNTSMFPVIQAQELMQPHLAEQFPIDVKNALVIPNEEIQFQSVLVVDDAGETHKVEGGSPFGTIIRDFQRVPERDVQGPALAGSGNKPVIEIRLPDENTIPGNVLVRSGFDKVQAYQHESVGTGGLQRPDLPDPLVKSNFDSLNTNPETNPFYENRGYERIDSRAEGYPFSRTGEISNDSFLETTYEPHDRGLFFHLTKKGFSYTERQPLGYSSGSLVHNPLTYVSVNGSTGTVNTTVNADIWRAEQLPDGRSFFTVNGHIVSFTGVSGSTFTGCKYSSGFAASNGNALLPSFFVPSGTTRHFAARRLRDHSEVSGESPDKQPIDWMGTATDASPASVIRSDRLTPMPLPRMGHNYVTPTMAMMPGHLAHPL